MELKIEHVTKVFRDKTAVNDVSLTLTNGIWGLLGANGAGKTTLMRMIAGISQPDQGTVCYDGIPIGILKGAYRSVFGYLPQEFGYYPEFTVRDYLEYMSVLKGLPVKTAKAKIDHLMHELSLTEIQRKKIRKLSGGMKRRVGIAQALLNDPEVLLLDEPTSGLDPGERIRFRNLISQFAQERIVLISTHIVPDVEYITSENIIMKNGEIISVGSSDELAAKMKDRVFSSVIPLSQLPIYEQMYRIINIRNIERGQVEIRFLTDRPKPEGSCGCDPRLEDYYLWLFPEEGGHEA